MATLSIRDVAAPAGTSLGADQDGLLELPAAGTLGGAQDVAVVGYDDIDHAAAASTPLTTIRRPRLETGRPAVRLFPEEITDRTAHRHRAVAFPPEPIVRDSAP